MFSLISKILFDSVPRKVITVFPTVPCSTTQRQLFVRKSFHGKLLELVLIKFYTRNSSSLKNPIFIFLDAVFIVVTNFPPVRELKVEKMLSHIFIGSVLHADVL